VQITEDRKKRVIDLYFDQHKTYAEIAEIERISPRDIHAIIKEEKARRQKYEHEKQQQEISSKAYKLFSEKKSPVEVAIILNLKEPEATKLFIEYCKLRRLHKFYLAYKELGDNGIGYFVKLGKLAKKKGWGIEKVMHALDIAGDKLPYMESLYGQVKEQVDNMQRTRQRLVNDIHALEYKISILDKTAFACEQDCRRKEQQVQELIDKKNRIEKLIGKILNNDNEGYSMLKQLVKENVKAALSENKKVISVALTALVQTLTSDPQTINIIYKIQAANEDGQHKDDNNDNVTKYFESNKDKILDLAKKHYENIVEALTNKFIGTTTTASPSSSPTLSLPQSSSTFPNLSDQSNTYSIEEPEIYYDNSKGDIAD
jgi:hypothetical protein